MSYGYYWCKKCKDYQKLHETNPPFIWCDHNWEKDLDFYSEDFNTDDQYEEWISRHPKGKKIEEVGR